MFISLIVSFGKKRFYFQAYTSRYLDEQPGNSFFVQEINIVIDIEGSLSFQIYSKRSTIVYVPSEGSMRTATYFVGEFSLITVGRIALTFTLSLTNKLISKRTIPLLLNEDVESSMITEMTTVLHVVFFVVHY